MELKLTQPSLPTPIFNSSSLLPKQFALLTQRWKPHIRSERIFRNGQGMIKKFFVHVVKEAETVTSISRLDVAAVPIVADKDIVGVNPFFEGQHLDMNMPSAIAGFAQLCPFEGSKSHKIATDFGLHGRQWYQSFTVLTPGQLTRVTAKTTGSFLVLVPLVAFCFQSIIAAFRHRASRNLRASRSEVHHHHHGSNGMRWKTVLSDLRDPEALDTEFYPDSALFVEEKEQLHIEDMSHTYNKLEDEYQKFLSECGMSKWGYWRGGSDSGSGSPR